MQTDPWGEVDADPRRGSDASDAGVKLVATSKRPCNLKGGEVRRVSQNRNNLLIGYHVCCRRCGFVVLAINGHEGLAVTEGTEPDDITFSQPLRCTYCRVLMHVSHGQLRLEEDAHVRSVRYR